MRAIMVLGIELMAASGAALPKDKGLQEFAPMDARERELEKREKSLAI